MRSLNVFRQGLPAAVVVILSGWMLPAVSAQPSLEALGKDRYQLGAILIDKAAGEFSVDGRVVRDQQPLEYLAVKKEGNKSYEALLELDTTAKEFNIACILIGLDSAHAVLPEYHFDARPVVGDLVELLFEWKEEGEARIFRPEEFFLLGDKPVSPGEWVYTGSSVLPDGRYLAEEAGTLVGFIHDPDSIIEHHKGIGLGRYGEVTVNRSILPPVGTPVRLTVRNLHRTLPKSENQPGRATREKP